MTTMARRSGGRAPLLTYREVRLATQTLTDGGVFTLKLPSQYGWKGLWIYVQDTLGTANPTALALDNNLNQISRLQLRANGRPVFDLPANDSYYRHKFLIGTIGQRIAATSGAGAQALHNFAFYIPFTLPRPAKYPGCHTTMFPAGLINSIELQVTCPPNLLNAVYTAAGVNGATYTSAPTLTVSAVCADLDNAQLLTMVKAAGHGYIQNEFEQVVTAAATTDQELTGGRGVLTDLYFRALDAINAPATAGSQTLVTDQKLIIGNNDYPLDSAFLPIQAAAKQFWQIEGGGTNPGSSQLGTTFDPLGTWMYSFNQDGLLNQGQSLVGQPSVKLRSTVAIAPTAPATLSVITGIIDPNFYQTVL